MSLFYCAKCNHKDLQFKFNDRLSNFTNIRDGYGMFIHHVDCSKCGYELGGVITRSMIDDVEEFYYIRTIQQYAEPNIDGYWKNEDREKVLQFIKERKDNRFIHGMFRTDVDGYDFVSIFGDNVICSMTIEELKTKPYPKSNRKPFKIINGKKVYV